jgi:hypothetical protein
MTIRRFMSVFALAVLVLGGLLPAFAGHGRSRPSGGSAGARAGGSAQARSAGYSRSSNGAVATRPSGSGSYHGGGAHASGSARYGYGGYGRGYGYYGYPYYRHWWWGPYSYPYYWWYWGWGYPYWGYPAPRRVILTAGDARAPGVVLTQIRPKKATVAVDGQVVGQARDYNGKWDQLFVPAGDHTMRFSREGYMDLELYVRVESGRTIVIDEELRKGEGLDPRSTRAPDPPPERAQAAPATGRDETLGQPRAAPTVAPSAVVSAPSGGSLRSGMLSIRAAPSDAAVYLDGEFLASAAELSRLHGSLPVAQGDHLIEVVRPGFVSRQEVVSVGDDLARIFIDLQPE